MNCVIDHCVTKRNTVQTGGMSQHLRHEVRWHAFICEVHWKVIKSFDRFQTTCIRPLYRQTYLPTFQQGFGIHVHSQPWELFALSFAFQKSPSMTSQSVLCTALSFWTEVTSFWCGPSFNCLGSYTLFQLLHPFFPTSSRF